jgi:hypothetical protein
MHPPAAFYLRIYGCNCTQLFSRGELRDMYSGDETITHQSFRSCLHFEDEQGYSWTGTKTLRHAKALFLQVRQIATRYKTWRR